MYFAYTFPWSTNDNIVGLSEQKFLDKIIAKNAHREDLYIRRELVTRSVEGRPMELLTVTGKNGMTGEREALIEGLFPDADPQKRPFKFEGKKYVYVSSRVHPGEVAASHMLNGFIGYLLSDGSKDLRVRLALHHFVFVIVPMLNPDGVYRGHYRTDTHGNNLNRCYLSPSRQTMPTIYAADKLLQSSLRSPRPERAGQALHVPRPPRPREHQQRLHVRQHARLPRTRRSPRTRSPPASSRSCSPSTAPSSTTTSASSTTKTSASTKAKTATAKTALAGSPRTRSTTSCTPTPSKRATTSAPASRNLTRLWASPSRTSSLSSRPKRPKKSWRQTSSLSAKRTSSKTSLPPTTSPRATTKPWAAKCCRVCST